MRRGEKLIFLRFTSFYILFEIVNQYTRDKSVKASKVKTSIPVLSLKNFCYVLPFLVFKL